jgi:GNAT superfamily N-acetyltransferase
VNWEPIDLAKIEPRPAIGPTVGGVGLIYPGKRHVFSGPPESAKTLAAYAVALEEVRLGGNVLLIDFEMGRWDARDRLREMGATDADLERMFYVEPETPASEEIVEDLVSRWTFSLVVIDAAAGAYSLQALDDNKRADVEAFARIYVRSFWLRGIATILLDHVTKNADARGRFAIGSERKIGGADVHLGFEPVLPIRRGGRGLYRIVTHKDRLGHLPRPRAAELEFRSDPETHALSWTFRAPDPAADAAAWRPTNLMEKVSRYLEGASDAPTRNEIERNVPGTARYVRAAIDALIAEGYAAETAGPNRSRPVRSVRPFREAGASECVGGASDAPVADVRSGAAVRRTPIGATHPDAPGRIGAPDGIGEEETLDHLLLAEPLTCPACRVGHMDAYADLVRCDSCGAEITTTEGGAS